jgi:hypothetical protein
MAVSGWKAAQSNQNESIAVTGASRVPVSDPAVARPNWSQVLPVCRSRMRPWSAWKVRGRSPTRREKAAAAPTSREAAIERRSSAEVTPDRHRTSIGAPPSSRLAAATPPWACSASRV